MIFCDSTRYEMPITRGAARISELARDEGCAQRLHVLMELTNQYDMRLYRSMDTMHDSGLDIAGS